MLLYILVVCYLYKMFICSADTIVITHTSDIKQIMHFTNPLSAKKRTTKFMSENLKKNIMSKLCHIKNSKTRGQIV